ncbi:unnamed protein product [Arctia plantaginis]|uniref:Uncharacterized protein n=1 Tax=Arctia plantaginis TaxID=874455 RepID=A0A8S1AWG2_ARCPL|nr:unnamed protein product [Arctia plantaginis]
MDWISKIVVDRHKKHSGAQMRIKAVNQNDQFVACTNHSLNLKPLTDVTGQGVKGLIETRWSSRYEAVAVMKTHYNEILEVLESFLGNIAENVATRSDAGLLLTALQSLSFLAFLGLWSRVLREVNDAQLYLQAKGLNVHQCAMKIHALESILVDNRDVLVNDGLDYAKNICEDLGIEIIPRRTRKLKNMAVENASNPGLTYENRLSQEMFEWVDRIIKEIKTRFQQLHELDVKCLFSRQLTY